MAIMRFCQWEILKGSKNDWIEDIGYRKKQEFSLKGNVRLINNQGTFG